MTNPFIKFLEWLQKEMILAIGWLIFIVGVLTFPLPIPLGLPLLVIGAVIVLKRSIWAKRAYIRFRLYVRRKQPAWKNYFNKFEHIVRRNKQRLMQQRLLRRRKKNLPPTDDKS